MLRIAISCAVFFFQFCQVLYADDIVSEYLRRMTLKEKVGQILFIGFQGQEISPDEIHHIKRISPGGIVFYRRNLKNATDITKIVSKIQSIYKTNHELPIFYAIDQEGGVVHRIEGELFRPPSAPAIGATNSKDIARQVGLSVGNALRNLGININLAPVLDVPDSLSSPMAMRSYSDNHSIVRSLGVAYIHGIKYSGLFATAKHFPGIGKAHEDSHFNIPRVNQDDKDMIPFIDAIKAGIDMIMVGHFIVEPGDTKNTSSLSPYWMRDVLRKELRFDGLIIMDNIEMKAIEEVTSISDAAVRSFQAGADIIMISHERKTQKEVFNALLNAVKKGDIPPERLDESVRRIILTKRKLMENHKDRGMEFSSNLKDVSRSVAENSTIALRSKDVPPLKMSNNDWVLYAGNNLVLLNIIRGIQPNTVVLNKLLSGQEKTKDKKQIKQLLEKTDAFIIIDSDYHNASEVLSICNELNKEYVLILNFSRNIQKTIDKLRPNRIIVTFENNSIYLQTVAEIIFGIRKAKGRLPYDLGLSSDYIYE